MCICGFTSNACECILVVFLAQPAYLLFFIFYILFGFYLILLQRKHICKIIENIYLHRSYTIIYSAYLIMAFYRQIYNTCLFITDILCRLEFFHFFCHHFQWLYNCFINNYSGDYLNQQSKRQCAYQKISLKFSSFTHYVFHIKITAYNADKIAF